MIEGGCMCVEERVNEGGRVDEGECVWRGERGNE